jgi:hypothetical protein
MIREGDLNYIVVRFYTFLLVCFSFLSDWSVLLSYIVLSLFIDVLSTHMTLYFNVSFSNVNCTQFYDMYLILNQPV